MKDEKREARCGMRELSAASVRAAERYYKDEKNVEQFNAWRDARKREHEEKEAKAC